MEFVETSVFSDYVKSELNDESYRELQAELIGNPTKGQVMRGSGGARKVRWAGNGSGKSEKANLTDVQTKTLHEYIKRHLK
ncbi:MAG: transcriptional regulator [Rhodothermia bacterium]